VRAVHPFDLTGRVALVTGGNGGIGLAAAFALAEAGASIAIWGRSEQRNSEAVDRLRAVTDSVVAQRVDVNDAAAIDAGFTELVATAGRVDAVFVNAGVMVPVPTFLDITADIRQTVLDTNLVGAWQTIAAAVAHMKARAEAGDPGGSIIVNGSLSVFDGLPGGEHYGAAKAALSVVAKGVAVEYGRFGIRANTICPGFIVKDGAVPRFGAELAARGPIPRYGTPEEIAGIVVYLSSDAARYHNGDIITIDGGWRANFL
jgi:NAD(P)-dependent dehydrogenase (short-subunit alcohol dehydrogenase family)